MKLRELAVVTILLLPGHRAALAVPQAAPQNDTSQDQFFAGIVVESSAEQVTVARILLGKNETRVFRITVETKVEGRLVQNARVTVGWVTSDDGDRATLIIVREERKK